MSYLQTFFYSIKGYYTIVDEKKKHLSFSLLQVCDMHDGF